MGNKAIGVYREKGHTSKGVIGFSGWFLTNSTSQPTTFNAGKGGWSVARTGVGVFVVTLNRALVDLIPAAWLAVALGTKVADVTAMSLGSGALPATFTITLQSAKGTAADTTGDKICFSAEGITVAT